MFWKSYFAVCKLIVFIFWGGRGRRTGPIRRTLSYRFGMLPVMSILPRNAGLRSRRNMYFSSAAGSGLISHDRVPKQYLSACSRRHALSASARSFDSAAWTKCAKQVHTKTIERSMVFLFYIMALLYFKSRVSKNLHLLI